MAKIIGLSEAAVDGNSAERRQVNNHVKFALCTGLHGLANRDAATSFVLKELVRILTSTN
jgi:hypothetical protein